MFRTFGDVTRPALTEPQGPSCINRVYICDLCSEGWSSETEVEIHRSRSHKKIITEMMNDKDKPICKMCMTEFAEEKNLLSHIKTEHLLSSATAIRVERDIFICADCGDIFFNKSLLVYHIFYSHMPKTEKYVFKCPSCFKRIRLRTCWYHFLHHKLQSVAVCKICLIKLKDRITLSKHMRTHPNLYKCDTCAYVTKRKDLFDVHIHKVHKKPNTSLEEYDETWMKYYVSRKCRRTWQQINLMGWKGVRLTNDVHICILCREICVGVANMKRHILVDHMGERSVTKYHQCSCGKLFTSKVLQKQHMLKFKDQHKS